VAPLLTVLLALLISGIVVLLTTGSVGDTLETYRAIFRGSGLSWFFEVGSHDVGVPFTDAHVWFPWNTDDIESAAAANLQQTLILWVPLVLTGLAVAFAFRCGLFNIGGQGQYLAGSIAAVLIATELPNALDLPGWLLVVVTVVGATLAGAMLTLWVYVDIPPVSFLQRLQDAVDFSSFWSGLIKAPFMALIIGVVAAVEGLKVGGSAESLGRHVTSSVVKSIFVVILIDGLFAMFYASIDF